MSNEQTPLIAEEISQWVIDNRLTPWDGLRMTDVELFHILTDKINQHTAQLRQELERVKAQRNEAMKWAKYFKPWSSTWPESVEADFKEFLSSLEK